jgi:hypothetical protein
MCVRARVAPSGTVYLPQYYTDLGFQPVAAATAFSDGPGAALAALAREKVRMRLAVIDWKRRKRRRIRRGGRHL